MFAEPRLAVQGETGEEDGPEVTQEITGTLLRSGLALLREMSKQSVAIHTEKL